MIDLYKNDQLYNIVAEGEISGILAHYNSDYIMSIIQDNIKNINIPGYTPANASNIVESFEMNFKDLKIQYPSDTDNIEQARQETYQEIIDIICQYYGLQLNITDPLSTDNHSIAYYLYDFFISNYKKYIVQYFTKVIILNKESIYNNLKLYEFKRDRDSSTIYVKKAYSDVMIATIISKLKNVIYYISGFDTPIQSLVSSTYQPNISDYICSWLYTSRDIFKEFYCNIVNDPYTLTDIRLEIQKNLQSNIEPPIEQPQVEV